MIQRKQTIFLILAAVAAIVLIFVPTVQTSVQLGSVSLFSSGEALADGSNMIIGMVLSIIVAVVAVAAIFLFNNRPLQAKVVVADLVLTLALQGYLAWQFFRIYSDQTVFGDAQPHVGLFLPMLVLVFLFLAHRGIKADEKLIRSMDRLR